MDTSWLQKDYNYLFVSESFAMGKLHKDTAMFITNLVAEGRGEEDIIQVTFSWKPIYLDVYTTWCVNIFGVKMSCSDHLINSVIHHTC